MTSDFLSNLCWPRHVEPVIVWIWRCKFIIKPHDDEAPVFFETVSLLLVVIELSNNLLLVSNLIFLHAAGSTAALSAECIAILANFTATNLRLSSTNTPDCCLSKIRCCGRLAFTRFKLPLTSKALGIHLIHKNVNALMLAKKHGHVGCE